MSYAVKSTAIVALFGLAGYSLREIAGRKDGISIGISQELKQEDCPIRMKLSQLNLGDTVNLLGIVFPLVPNDPHLVAERPLLRVGYQWPEYLRE